MKDNTTYFEGQITKLQSMADNSWNLTINIPEYADEETVPKLTRMKKQQTTTKVLLSTENVVTNKTLEEFEKIETTHDGKNLSPSQRLRNKLYGKWMEMKGDPARFNTFYENEIEYICSQISAQIAQLKDNE